MEIEFNPGRIPERGASEAVTRRPPARPAAESEPFERTQTLQRTLKEANAVRPEQVERARGLVADVKYPPDEMLDRIAHLLALNAAKQ